MFEWYFLLTPFAVLAVLLLFSFVGCNLVLGLDDYRYGPTYLATILGEPGLVAYWRLHDNHSEEPGTPTIDNTPLAGGPAKDELGLNYGAYNRVIVTGAPPDSSDAPGTLLLEAEGLLESSTEVNSSVLVDGGFVEVPFGNLSLTSFTVEALVFPGWSAAETGIYRAVFAFTDFSSGFAIYSGPADPADPSSPPVWQLWLGDGTQYQRVPFNSGTPPEVDVTKTSYIAVTFDASNNKANLYTYRPGMELDNGPFRPVLDSDVAFQPNADPAPRFFIGVERATTPGFDPFKGRIQEVAVYNLALPMERIGSHAVQALGL